MKIRMVNALDGLGASADHRARVDEALVLLAIGARESSVTMQRVHSSVFLELWNAYNTGDQRLNKEQLQTAVTAVLEQVPERNDVSRSFIALRSEAEVRAAVDRYVRTGALTAPQELEPEVRSGPGMLITGRTIPWWGLLAIAAGAAVAGSAIVWAVVRRKRRK